jgi:hypothetical protein
MKFKMDEFPIEMKRKIRIKKVPKPIPERE